MSALLDLGFFGSKKKNHLLDTLDGQFVNPSNAQSRSNFAVNSEIVDLSYPTLCSCSYCCGQVATTSHFDNRPGQADDKIPPFVDVGNGKKVAELDAYNAATDYSFSSTSQQQSWSEGESITLTWSIVLDGTTIFAAYPGEGQETGGSNLQAKLTALYGSEEIWLSLFQQSFDRISSISGVNYVYVDYDDGASIGGTNNTGVDGVRADIRIGGITIDGAGGILAYNYFPDYGDMVIDTSELEGQGYFTSTGSNSLAFRNMIQHEALHGLGISHTESSDSSFLMEPFINTSFDGVQYDDISAVQSRYGDALEQGAGNNSFSTAYDLGLASSSLSIGFDSIDMRVEPDEVSFYSIHNASDVDYFYFGISQASILSLTLTPTGPSYRQSPQGGDEFFYDASSQNNLGFNVYDSSQNLIVEVDNGSLGFQDAWSSDFALAGNYYVKIFGTSGVFDTYQSYQFDIALEPATPNQSPTASNDDVQIQEDTSVSIDVLLNDSDPDADILVISSFDTNSLQGGQVVLNQVTNELEYTPVLNFFGTDQFTYQVSDGNGGFDTATVQINVLAVNDDPVANNDTATTEQETPVIVNVLANDEDVDGDALELMSTSEPLNGSVSISNGEVVYTPNSGFTGDDSFTYIVSDGLLSSSAEVTITVNPMSEVVTALDAERVDGDFGNYIENTSVEGTFVKGDGISAVLREEIQPVTGGRKPKNGSVLDRVWEFSGLNSATSFTVTASLDGFDQDEIQFSYSTDLSGGWIDFSAIRVNSSSLTTYTQEGLSLSGTVYVRAVDTDRSPSNGNSTPDLSELSIDFMGFEQVNDPSNGGPGSLTAIGGDPVVGSTLVAPEVIGDPDGFTKYLEYKWYVSGTEVKTYVPGSEGNPDLLVSEDYLDLGKEITVVVRYLDGEGYEESVTSESVTISLPAPGNVIEFTADRDELLGVENSVDLFTLNNLTDALVGGGRNPSTDSITGLELSSDKLDFTSANQAADWRGDGRYVGDARSLKNRDLGRLLTSSAFQANDIVAFSVSGDNQSIYLAVNDQFNGFDNSTDAIIRLIGIEQSDVNNIMLVA